MHASTRARVRVHKHAPHSLPRLLFSFPLIRAVLSRQGANFASRVSRVGRPRPPASGRCSFRLSQKGEMGVVCLFVCLPREKQEENVGKQSRVELVDGKGSRRAAWDAVVRSEGLGFGFCFLRFPVSRGERVESHLT